MDRQIASLKQQMELQKRIVPDEKGSRQVHHPAARHGEQFGHRVPQAGSEISCHQGVLHEVPYSIELDGPYIMA